MHMNTDFQVEKKRIRSISALLAVIFVCLPFAALAVTETTTPPDSTTSTALQNATDAQERDLQIRLEVPLPYITHPCVPDPAHGITQDDQCVADVNHYVAAAYRFLVGLAGVLALAVIVFAGFGWIQAAGSAEKIKVAKGQITGALLGLFLALFSYTLLQMVNPDLLNLGFVQPNRLNKEMQALISDTKVVCPEANGISCGSYGPTINAQGALAGCMGTMCGSSEICHITADEREILVSGTCEGSVLHKVNESSAPVTRSVATTFGGLCGQKTLVGNIGNSCTKWDVSRAYLYLTAEAMVTIYGGSALIGVGSGAAAAAGAGAAGSTAAGATTAAAGATATSRGLIAVTKSAVKWTAGKAVTAGATVGGVELVSGIKWLMGNNSFCFYVGDYVTGDPVRQVDYFHNSAGASYKNLEVGCPACYLDPDNCAQGVWKNY